jgi:hypothetical protein
MLFLQGYRLIQTFGVCWSWYFFFTKGIFSRVCVGIKLLIENVHVKGITNLFIDVWYQYFLQSLLIDDVCMDTFNNSVPSGLSV